MLSCITLLSPYIRTSAFWGLEENFSIISLILSYIFLNLSLLDLKEGKKKYLWLFILCLFSSSCLYFDYKFTIIPIICFVQIFFSKLKIKYKIFTVITYLIFSLPLFYLLISYGSLFSYKAQSTQFLGKIIFWNNPIFAITIIAFYILPLYLFLKEKIIINTNKYFLFFIMLLVMHLIFIEYFYDTPEIKLHSDIGGGFVKKIALILFYNEIYIKLFYYFFYIISFLIIYIFLNNNLNNWLIFLYFLILSLIIYPLLQEYFDPLIFLVFLLFCKKKFFLKYTNIIIVFIYFFTFLIFSNIYYYIIFST